ncbi:ABC transporter, ATP-binding protein [Desulfocucumis palustris]|uniref:ABC transporter, ATP-binding protein n=1 Tax=Desulfocucumis palustris TaxID=1898651 RepID=A0A2L2XEJ8_9FIRM|nr:AAA family ATPase [Desulfocucumis palustris]GBF34789.1 ABC transporter, ATP-binding protein [Desulfocucumis palustris]
MHLTEINLLQEKYPSRAEYPFCLDVFNATGKIVFTTPVTFFIGENGSGKSTLLKALARACNIHIWKDEDSGQNHNTRYSEDLYKYMDIVWSGGTVPGSFFASEYFRNFADNIDRWAKADPGILKYYGGENLLTKSHGQYHMAFFKSRYRIKGLYLLDEPENALSPGKQLELLKILKEMSLAGHSQFIIASHSPILLALPGATIYSFDHIPVKQVPYEKTEHYLVYRDFLNNRDKYLNNL